MTNSGQGERSKRAAVLTGEGCRREGVQGMLRGRGCVNKHDGHVRYQLSGSLETDSEKHNRAGTRGLQEPLRKEHQKQVMGCFIACKNKTHHKINSFIWNFLTNTKNLQKRRLLIQPLSLHSET